MPLAVLTKIKLNFRILLMSEIIINFEEKE